MRVLAIGCHPDDLELNAYGTLAKCVKRGDEVYICGVTTGDQGHYKIMPNELAKIRVKEAKNASKIIGAKEYYNLGAHDVLVSRYDIDLVNKLIDYIRKVNPDFIITQYPKDFMMDHEETSALALRAAFMATLPHYCTKEGAYPEKVPANIPIYYMAPTTKTIFTPSHYVDISGEVDVKMKAMMCHKSQLEWLGEHDNTNIMAIMQSQTTSYGKVCGVAYAEGFKADDNDGRVVPRNLLP